jgi:hypothetical protein
VHHPRGRVVDQHGISPALLTRPEAETVAARVVDGDRQAAMLAVSGSRQDVREILREILDRRANVAPSYAVGCEEHRRREPMGV